MADVTVARFDDLEPFHHGTFRRLRAGLGVRAFGTQLVTLPPHCDLYPDHHHADSGQEEMYVTLSGRASLRIGDEVVTLEPGTFVRVGPDDRRMVTTGDDPVQLLVVGATPGAVYKTQLYTELGGVRALLTASPTRVAVGEEFELVASATRAATDEELSFAWDLEGAGTLVEAGHAVRHRYDHPGVRRASVQVTTADGRWDTASVEVVVD